MCVLGSSMRNVRGGGSWNVRFELECQISDFNEWELVSVNPFLNLLHSNIPRRKGCDRMSWSLRGSGASDV